MSQRKKIVMIILSVLGFHIGLQYFYAGLTKKALLMLIFYWPCMVLGWVFLPVAWYLLIVQAALMVMAVRDFIKLIKGNLLDGNGLPIVN